MSNAFEKLMQGARSSAAKGQKQGQQQGQKRPAAAAPAPAAAAAAAAPGAGPAKRQQTTHHSRTLQASPEEQQPEQQRRDGSSVQAANQEHAARVAAFRQLFTGRAKQKFRYLLVCDLEATTNQARTLHPIEIIELACVIIDTTTAAITAPAFQAFVRPTEHPQLDPFCSQLTGITQAQVDAAQPLAAVLQQHHGWLQQQGLFAPGVTFVPVTWTSWDFKVALSTECGWRGIQQPAYLRRWVDLKQLFFKAYKRRGNLRSCVEAAGLTWQGRPHSGLDDATNTARLAIKLIKQGVAFEITEAFEGSENPLQQPSTSAAAAAGNSNTSAAAGSASAKHITAAAAAAGAIIPPPHSSPRSSSAEAPAAAGSSSQDAGGSPPGGRSSMQALAAAKGLTGVFSSGRWRGVCFCMVKAQPRTTKKPGPNHGRTFYGCGSWRITQQSRSCGFFLWSEDVPPGSTLPT